MLDKSTNFKTPAFLVPDTFAFDSFTTQSPVAGNAKQTKQKKGKSHPMTPPKKKSRPAPRTPFASSRRFPATNFTAQASRPVGRTEVGVGWNVASGGATRGEVAGLNFCSVLHFPLPTSKKRQTRLVLLSNARTRRLTALLSFFFVFLFSFLACFLPLLSLEIVHSVRATHSAVVAAPNAAQASCFRFFKRDVTAGSAGSSSPFRRPPPPPACRIVRR